MPSDYEEMAERNDPEGLRNYYIDRDGNRIPYDPKTVQPPVVYGKPPYTDADTGELEVVGPEGLIVHESHTTYESYPGDEDNPSPVMVGPDWDPVEVDRPADDPLLTARDINGYGIDLASTNLYQDQIATEDGKFHIRYYGVVEHADFAQANPGCADDDDHTGLVSLAVRGMGHDHLHTDVHTFNPLKLLVPGSCPPGSRVRIDIQDFDSVILDYIYNYPRELHYSPDYTGNPTAFESDTYVELGQWDGNKKMQLSEFLQVISKHFNTSLGTLAETLAQYDRDHDWIVKVPTQVGMTLDEDDAVTLPYSHLPKAYVRGEFEHNPATHMAKLSFDYVDYLRIPFDPDQRVHRIDSPQLFRAGTVPAALRPKSNMRLTAYAEATVRTGRTEIVDEDRDAIDLVIRPDGSVWVDGSLWFQQHEMGRPGVRENDRWRVEIASRSGLILM